MAGENNDFKIIIGADIADAKSKLKDLSNSLSSLSRNTGVASGSIGSSMGKISSLFSGLGATLSVASFGLFIKSALQTSAQLEQTAIAFEVFTGSALTAKNMLSELKDQALKSPMQFQDITKGAQILLGYGLTAQQVIPITKMLGDISGGNADKFSRLSLAFGQVNAAGRLMGQEARQMINAGFNPLQAISDKTGVSMAVLTKRMHDGQISVKDVGDAFTYATSEGGRFFGMADRQSQTLQGQFNKLSESTTFAMAEIGASISKNLQLGDVITHIAVIVEQLKNSFVSLNEETNNSSEFNRLLKGVLDVLGITIDLTIKSWGLLTLGLGELLKLSTPVITFFDKLDASIIESTKNIPYLGAAIKNVLNYFNDFGKEDLSPKTITASIDALEKKIAGLEGNKILLEFNSYGYKELEKTISNYKKELEILKINSGKSAGLTGLSDKPTGLDKKDKKEKVEVIPGTDFQTKEYGNHLKKLRQISADAISEINNLGLQGNKKKLADLQDAFTKEKAEFVRYGQDTTDITRLYLLKAAQISGEIEAERMKGLLSIIKPLPGMEGGMLGKVLSPEQLAKFEASTQIALSNAQYFADKLKFSFQNLGESMRASVEEFTQMVSDGFANMFVSIGEGGGAGEAIKSFGATILSALGDMFIKIGTGIVMASKIMILVQTFLTDMFTPFGAVAGLVGGLALMALGGVMKGAASQITKPSPTSSQSTKPSVSSKASGSTYAYGGSSYSTQSIRMMVDLTGSITATPTGYSINKSFETTLRVTGR
jgi:tape measure domain-containing protein